MKIIVQGRTARQRINGMKKTCTQCDCQIEITEEDKLSESSSQRDGRSFSIKCPTDLCSGMFTFADPKDSRSYFPER